VSGADVKRLKARQQLLDVIKRGAPFQVLIIREESRFSRRDGVEAFGELRDIVLGRVQVWFYKDRTRFSFGTFGDNVAGFVKAEAAADYRRQISGWTFDAHKNRALAGYCTGGRCFGYENVRVGGHVERRIVERGDGRPQNIRARRGGRWQGDDCEASERRAGRSAQAATGAELGLGSIDCV
jgi:hypothetical protein